MPTYMKPLPSLTELNSALTYNEVTGKFTRISNGKEAGFAYTRGDKKRTDIRIKVNGVAYLAHRLAWKMVTGEDPDQMEIDHINGDSTDNRFSNLRLVERVSNCRNMKRRSDNSSGITGVCFDKSNNRYLVQIGTDAGRFTTLVSDFFEACCLRKSLENRTPKYSKRHGM